MLWELLVVTGESSGVRWRVVWDLFAGVLVHIFFLWIALSLISIGRSLQKIGRCRLELLRYKLLICILIPFRNLIRCRLGLRFLL